ncbi:MAG: PEP-CTERM sorting domain-containing protein [Pirellulales bacterium]|nr:PEP-CTERM sorting domain-containing protein [Pirellulales bacterium]
MRKLTWAALAVVVCTLLTTMPAPARAELSIDFNDRTDPDITQSGFDVFLIDAEDGTPVTRTFGAHDVTLYDVGGSFYFDRDRTGPPNGGAFTESDLLIDFVFSGNSAGGGLNLKVTGLTPFGIYSGSIWSVDDVSSGVRMSDWIANGTVVKNNYVYDGADISSTVPPPSNDTYRIDFTATASADGTIMFQGRHEKRSDGVSVMLNGLQLTQTGTLQRAATPVVRADFGSGTAMSGFTQVNLASATAGATVGGKTITVAPVGKFSEIPSATSYEVFVNFWSDSANDWAIQAGLTETGMATYDVNNSTNTGIISSNRTLYTASLGTLTPAQLDSVYWDDIEQSSSYERTWLDSFTIRRTDDDELFYVAPTADNSYAVDNPSGPWFGSSDTADLWRYRSGYAEYADGIYQALKSSGDHYQIVTTLDDPVPGIPETIVTLSEGDTGTVAGGVEFTQSDLLADYITASNGDVDTSGLDVLVEDLTPGQQYSVTLWAFDDAAGESTRSTWSANGALVNDGYRFDASQDPMTNLEYSFSFLATADENGQILLEGRVGLDGAEGLAQGNVYLNALEICEVVPEPSTVVLLLGAALAVLCFRRRR